MVDLQRSITDIGIRFAAGRKTTLQIAISGLREAAAGVKNSPEWIGARILFGPI
jgi:hypothetical protein